MRSEFAQSRVVYAAKAFMCKYMCKIIADEGAWLLAASGGELAIALASGFPASKITMHGNNKTLQEIEEALDVGVGRIAVDNILELETINKLAKKRGLTQSVLLRIKPGVVADTHDFIITGAEDSKFGMGISDGSAMEAVKLSKKLKHIDVKGLHVHIGSQIFELSSFEETVKVTFDFLENVRSETGITFDEIDFGGGLGIAYTKDENPPAIDLLSKRLAKSVKAECERIGYPLPLVAVEPGRSIVANAGVTLYTVGNKKQLKNVRTFVSVDGGMSDNIRTALYDSKYEAIVANKADAERNEIVTIVGKHCESGDVLVYDASIQSVDVGDIICIFGTGAYNYSMASNYNKQVRPAVFFVADGKAIKALRRETYEDLMICEEF
jgi:diaminopimelate decarboxylase